MEAAKEALRTTLQTELDTLIIRRDKISAHLQNEDREVPQDWDDRAQLEENDEVLEGLLDRTRNRISEIQQAMLHMQDPDWGTCRVCEEPIAKGRLEALPTARTCIRCAEETGR